MSLSRAEQDAVEWTSFATNLISLGGSIFIIGNYVYYKELRNLAGKLVFMIAVSDAIVEFASLFMTPDNHTLCIIQGLILQFGSLASVLWVGCVCYTIYDIIVRKNISISDKQLWWYHVLVWGTSTILTILPLTTSSYGTSTGWCWVKDSNDADIDTAMRILTWYVVLLITIIYSFYMYYRIYEEVGDNVVVHRMRYYPIILFICYFPGFIFRLQKVQDNPHVALGIVYSFMKGMYGFLNAILFTFNNNVSRIYRPYCHCLPEFKPKNATIQHGLSQVSMSLDDIDDSDSITGDAVHNNVDLQVGTLHTTPAAFLVDSFSQLPHMPGRGSALTPGLSDMGSMASPGMMSEMNSAPSNISIQETPAISMKARSTTGFDSPELNL